SAYIYFWNTISGYCSIAVKGYVTTTAPCSILTYKLYPLSIKVSNSDTIVLIMGVKSYVGMHSFYRGKRVVCSCIVRGVCNSYRVYGCVVNPCYFYRGYI